MTIAFAGWHRCHHHNQNRELTAKAMPHLEDDPVRQTRLNMVEGQLKPGGVRDYALTKMIGTVSREAFVASDVRAAPMPTANCQRRSVMRRQLLSPLAFARLAELAI